MSAVNWVEQPDDPNGGCGIACLAMLLDLNYVQLTIAAPRLCARCGVDQDIMFDVLAEHGYAVQCVERVRQSDGQPREKWPPKPWAPKHLVCVTQKRTDTEQHYVVTDEKGIVYDPADKAFQRSRLSRYYRIEWVAGCFPVSN